MIEIVGRDASSLRACCAARNTDGPAVNVSTRSMALEEFCRCCVFCVCLW